MASKSQRGKSSTEAVAFRKMRASMFGEDTGTPVNLTYDVSFEFTGKIDKVTVALKPMEAATALQNDLRQREAALAKALRD